MIDFHAKAIASLRARYPVGTRLVVRDMSDPYHPVPSGTVGTVVHVDDAGQIHMNWDNGQTLALITGEDSFSQITAKTFYIPLWICFSRDQWAEIYDKLGAQDACEYLENIKKILTDEPSGWNSADVKHRGFAAFFDAPVLKDVYSVKLSAEIQNGKLFGVINCEFLAPLTETAQKTLFEELLGQFSDGWGEVFAQSPRKGSDGYITVHFWAKDKDNTIKEKI